MIRSFSTTAYIFGFYCIAFIPFPFIVFQFNGMVTEVVFGNVISGISNVFFGLNENAEISSDSLSMYILVGLLFVIALISVGMLSVVKGKIKYYAEAKTFISKALCYYLALQLLKYGVAKIFKAQFYLPEPNILYTPFGQLDKDILFWSTMGISRPYNLLLGFTEIIASSLLLSHRTRITGLLISTAVMLNVVMINFSFDISVKIFSLFLLFLSLLLLSPQLRIIWNFLILQKQTRLKNTGLNLSFVKFPALKITLKIFIICIMMTEAAYPFLSKGEFNDDCASRPLLHGAYEVTESQFSEQDADFNPRVKRFFIHRDGYIIFQYNDETMKDFRLSTDSLNHQLILTDYNLKQKVISYRPDSAGNPQLHYLENSRPVILQSTSLNWRELPALKDHFHWTIEGL